MAVSIHEYSLFHTRSPFFISIQWRKNPLYLFFAGLNPLVNPFIIYSVSKVLYSASGIIPSSNAIVSSTKAIPTDAIEQGDIYVPLNTNESL